MLGSLLVNVRKTMTLVHIDVLGHPYYSGQVMTFLSDVCQYKN